MTSNSGRYRQKTTPSAQALVWLREELKRTRGPHYTQEYIAELTGVASYRQYEYDGTRLTAEVYEKIVAGLGLSDQHASALADAAGLRPPTLDCQSVPRKLLSDMQETIDASPSPCYVTNPWWDVIASNDLAGEWISPALARNYPRSAERNAIVMLFQSSDRQSNMAANPFLDSFIAAYKSSLIRHWYHPWCRPNFDRTIGHMEKLSPYWATLWPTIAARDRDHVCSSWLITGTWDSDPSHPWYDPVYELHYLARTLVTEPVFASARTDYRFNTIHVPAGSPPRPTVKILRGGGVAPTAPSSPLPPAPVRPFWVPESRSVSLLELREPPRKKTE